MRQALRRGPVRLHREAKAEALRVGERLAISILRDQRATYNENFGGFTFTKFDGSTITV